MIRVDGSRVWIAVTETRNPGTPPGPDWEKYELSDDLVPTSFAISDHYWTFHRQMEAEGKIHHTAEQCPDHTQPKKVHVWSPKQGWKEITVPAQAEP